MDLTTYDLPKLKILLSGYESIIKQKNELLQRAVAESNKEEAGILKTEIGLIDSNIQKIQNAIKINSQTSTLKFSVAEFYYHAGQFDKFIWIELFMFSEAYNKYGKNIYGTAIYTKAERDQLEAEIKISPLSKTDGKIKFDAYIEDELLEKELREVGILASDIYEMNSFTFQANIKSYNKAGIKEIPNKLNVEMQWSLSDDITVPLMSYEMQIEKGHLLPNEWIHYCLLLLMTQSSKLTQELKNKYLFEGSGKKFHPDAIIYMGRTLQGMGLLESDSTMYRTYYHYLGIRYKERKEKFFKDMGINDSQWNKFSESHPDKATMIMGSIVAFEPDSLSFCLTSKPIYFNLDRFIHVYSRHCSEYFMQGRSSKQTSATMFQYTYKDIRHIIHSMITKYAGEIEKAMSDSKEFRVSSDSPFYYNGNHYVIRIAPDGLIRQFHALEEGKEEE